MHNARGGTCEVSRSERLGMVSSYTTGPLIQRR